MILKYISLMLIFAIGVNAKVANCEIGKGKEAFMSCLKKEVETTNAVKDYNLLGALYVADKKYEEAIQWYEKSAQQGDVKATFFIGGIYDEALGIEKEGFSQKVKSYLLGKDKTILANQKEAIKWYKKAAMQNYDDAMPHMNEMMEKVYGKEGTVKLYQQEIQEKKDVYWNKQFLANFYFRLHDYKKREDILKELIKEYPEQKADWLTMIADAYTEKYMNNREIEVKYYKEAAALGNKSAMHNLGIYYGDKKDYKTAETWFRKAGHDYMVCYMYKEIVKDKEKALECYEKEAQSGELDKIYNLAYTYHIMYAEYEKAIEWYKKGIELEGGDAALNMAVIYRLDLVDKEKMLYWYKKAASMGNLKAIQFLSKKGEL